MNDLFQCLCGGSENRTKSQFHKIHDLRKSVNLLTNIIIQLNRINRLLKELEQERQNWMSRFFFSATCNIDLISIILGS
jgi:hypothetical protein